MVGWKSAFTQSPHFFWDEDSTAMRGMLHCGNLETLKDFLDQAHAKECLLRPYWETKNYPLVESRELLPSFEVDIFEHKQLPGFSMVALERQIKPFEEVFQFDRLYNRLDVPSFSNPMQCPLRQTIAGHNVATMRSRLPRMVQNQFQQSFANRDISYLERYPEVLEYVLNLERAHVLSLDQNGEFYLSGIYASLPSDLDAEIKRFGLKIKKFRHGDNCLYERNRLFVYQYLMELYGFPIVSERRTSAAMFARRLFKMGERFLVRVLGQSDRVLTTIMSHPDARHYPRVEKMALLSVHPEQKDTIAALRSGGWFVDERRRVVLLRVTYQQHRFNPHNVREDRALSAVRQEIIHPLSGEARRDLNIIKDTYTMVLRLTDIVRGEYAGAIAYKRHELVAGTETHEKRLKFLHFWLSKHARRIIGYSDEFYAGVVKVLDSYLLSPDHFDIFQELDDLYQEVSAKYSYIRQARKVKILEDLLRRQFKGRTLTYAQSLEKAVETVTELKFELVDYLSELADSILIIGEQLTSDRYLHRAYVERPDHDLSDYGRVVRGLYLKLVRALEDFRNLRRQRYLPTPHSTEENTSIL